MPAEARDSSIPPILARAQLERPRFGRTVLLEHFQKAASVPLLLSSAAYPRLSRFAVPSNAAMRRSLLESALADDTSIYGDDNPEIHAVANEAKTDYVAALVFVVAFDYVRGVRQIVVEERYDLRGVVAHDQA